ncbi:hypothetical protein A3I48_02290 [Candidatus Daviesbacteria bacterium RIFCSPLOWO2_02_FULL_36_7]|uniref:Uncharacterized protein n=1 Tax=Candidatus Daviesbacteria bacterium RIFCSPLOWO2_02_FULL_36_7 TaxID=1797792 RepID=A0A1F5MG86_9BACT|nr:MAG: hypothetical protein A3I48_02290 [Candidatus Daviesbacteria bacterium RIFCSPLOWO2_02_FULL_36_7]
MNERREQSNCLGSDIIRSYFPYDRTRKKQRGNITSVMAINSGSEPPSIYDTRLRMVIINPTTNMVHIAFEGDHGENAMASYDYTQVRVIISQTNNGTIVL